MRKIELEKKTSEVKGKHFLLSFFFLIFIITPILVVSAYFFSISPPKNFPINSIVEIKKGDSVYTIGDKLEEAGIIRSGRIFSLLGPKIYKNKTLKSGKYIFSQKEDTWGVFEQLIQGKNIIPNDVKFTIKEGEPNWLIAKHIAKIMKNIEEDDFIAAARKYEGEMYPNTYFLDPHWNADQVVDRFRKEFQKKINQYKLKIDEDKKREILTKASLVESEAGVASYQIKRHVAGVIDHRLRINMPLQIDAVFFYIFKDKIKNRRIRKSHMKVDSKYNVYKYPGLPPGPISNPSINSIRAVLNPLKTKDLYYITGCDGQFYFATNGTQHNIYVQKYLRDKAYCSGLKTKKED